MSQNVIIRNLGQQNYKDIWLQMQNFTNTRNKTTDDEFWILQHNPVFTLGQNGKTEHLLDPKNIEVIKVDRGGQITYHGPGQLIIYTLIDLKRLKLNIRQIVTALEQSIIKLLSSLGVTAETKCKAPGVYVNEKKICSVGLRIRRGCSFHGLALNVDMDLEPFSRINPCGYKGLEMTQVSELDSSINMKAISNKLVDYLIDELGYTSKHTDNLLWQEK